MVIFSLQNCLADELISGEDSAVDDQSDVELHGYLEYDDEPEETIYLEGQGDTVENTVYLKAPSSTKSLNLKAPDRGDQKSLAASFKNQAQPSKLNQLRAASKFSTQEYEIKPVSASYTGKSGNLSYGTTYDSSVGGAQTNYSTGVFTKYDGKHFAVSTAYSKNMKSGYDSYNDQIFLAPELKLTKRLSLLDVMQTDISQLNKQNEVVLRYKPSIKNHADEVILELGAGQSFYADSYANSSVSFSTRFKL